MGKIALVCIAKDEDRYIQEWLDYNLKLGFDRVFIYENDWRASIVDDPRVTRVPFDGKGVQYAAYNNFVFNHGKDYEWAAFFDVDEFMVLKCHKNIQKFVQRYRKFSAVGINSVFFGDNNQPPPVDEYSVLKRFTQCSPVGDSLAKCVVRMAPSVRMGPAPYVNRKTVTTHKVPYKGCRSPVVETDIAQLNHYHYKSQSEYVTKVLRGKSSKERRGYRMVEFPITWANVDTDTTARDFLYGDCSGVHSKE